MPLPLVSIVGRPNVGKSSLLNMLAGRRISIVDPTAGVTRDRIQAVCEHAGRYFEVVDTGGYGVVDRDDLGEQVEQQIAFAVAQASLVLFVVDAKDGLLPLDEAVARWLRSCPHSVLLIANKVDSERSATELGEFPKLGFGEPLAASALHRRGERAIKDWIVEHLPEADADAVPGEAAMKLAIVGRRNSGKSTFINALAGQERVIVSEVPGTTRDAVDVRFEHHGKTFVAIDTAGVRKKSKIADDIEFYGFHRAQLSVRRADVVLLMIDATESVSQVDKRLGQYIAEQYKPCVVVINKWDLAKDRAGTDDYGRYLLATLPGLAYAPVAFVTASQGRNVFAVVDRATALFKQSRTRVATAALNEAIERITTEHPPASRRGVGRLKILYATQVAVCPPTVVLFTNDPSRAAPSFEQFLVNRLRGMLPFREVPIRVVYRGRRGLRAARGGVEHAERR